MYHQWRWVVKRSHWYNGKHEKLLLLQVSIVGCVSPASVAVPPARMPPCHACPHTHTPSMHAPTMHDPLPCPPPREQNRIGVKTLPSPLRGRGGRVGYTPDTLPPGFPTSAQMPYPPLPPRDIRPEICYPHVNRQTPVKTLPCRNFVGGSVII